MIDRDPRRPVPADPSGIEEPHDVLAADEFGIGTGDERLPPDPHRFDPPRDILAAEEFAMPVARDPSDATTAGDVARDPRLLIPLVLIAAIAAFLLARRRA
jgi:hypothetical protein